MKDFYKSENFKWVILAAFAIYLIQHYAPTKKEMIDLYKTTIQVCK